MVPIAVIVAVAIVCIVVAVLTSAQRADDVALANERELLNNAIATRGDWALRRLTAAIKGDPDLRAAKLPADPADLEQRVQSWRPSLIDQDIVVIAGPSGLSAYAYDGRNGAHTIAAGGAPGELGHIIDYLHGQGRLQHAARLAIAGRTVDHDRPGRVALLQQFTGRPAIVSAVRLGDANAGNREQRPVVLEIQFVATNFLDGVARRLQLSNLRAIGSEPVPAGDEILTFGDEHGHAVARFAWSPTRPGATILNSVVPFIAIALGGFVVLAGLILRYIRLTTATIAAGETRLRHLALHDPLCGLPNRIFFGERLETAIEEVKKQGGPDAAVFYIDLDHFKEVNDTLGHPVGDELIRNVTMRLTRTLRGNDLVARLGGDEFAVITSPATDAASVQAIARRIILALCTPYAIAGQNICIGASIGIAMIDARSGGAADIMRYADMALYRAKNEGRNRACIYDAAMDADLSQRKLIEHDLREAIANNGLHIAYQPIVNSSGEKIVGVEALARWVHPERGSIPPSEFITIAEHSGLIIELGEWVLRRACLDGKAWPGLTVSVNVSPLQFRRPDFVEMVERILAETEFDPASLELEVTESTLLGNMDSAEAAMHRLKALGVRLALDDFGTGYSSLLYLRRFPFDKLKIDRSFVLSIERAPDAAAIVHAVVSLGRGLGMKVTAEGVETAEQHLFLRAAGVHSLQGYRFGQPQPADEIAKRLTGPATHRMDRDAIAALAS